MTSRRTKRFVWNDASDARLARAVEILSTERKDKVSESEAVRFALAEWLEAREAQTQEKPPKKGKGTGR